MHMEHYTKGENVEVGVEVEGCLPECVEGVEMLLVQPSTKMRDIIEVALEKLKVREQVVWVGCGPAVVKAVSGAEVTKRRVRDLHQLTRLSCKRVEEYWEPKLEGLDTLRVTREIPAVVILLSKVPLDLSLPGYQAPGTLGEDFCRGDPKQRKQRKDHRVMDEHTTRNTDERAFENRRGKNRTYGYRRMEGDEWEERKGEEREGGGRGRGFRPNYQGYRGRGRGERGRGGGRGRKERENWRNSDDYVKRNGKTEDERGPGMTARVGRGSGVRNKGDQDYRGEAMSEYGQENR